MCYFHSVGFELKQRNMKCPPGSGAPTSLAISSFQNRLMLARVLLLVKGSKLTRILGENSPPLRYFSLSRRKSDLTKPYRYQLEKDRPWIQIHKWRMMIAGNKIATDSWAWLLHKISTNIPFYTCSPRRTGYISQSIKQHPHMEYSLSIYWQIAHW